MENRLGTTTRLGMNKLGQMRLGTFVDNFASGIRNLGNNPNVKDAINTVKTYIKDSNGNTVESPSTAQSNASTDSKPNYLLYGGIAVTGILAYFLLTKKTKK
ncbi:MAG: hypothetical protein ACKVOU_03650 [Cytophagales bacterium]